MQVYAQYNPNKGQGDLIKSNSPTSAHQLAPAPLRHAKDLTVMRQATQLIPWPPPPTSTPNYEGAGAFGECVLTAPLLPLSSTTNTTGQTAQPCHDPKDNGCSPRHCANMSPQRIHLVVMSCSYILEHKNDMHLFDPFLFKNALL